MIVIRGGLVLTPEGWVRADVSLDGGSVAAIGAHLHGETFIDATGCLVGPGFVDMHTHIRDPGQTWKEDLASASAAAAAGGFTAITAMPNTDPPMDRPKVVESVLAGAAQIGLVDVVPSAALTIDRAGVAATKIEDLHRMGVRLFTDDGDAVVDDGLLEEIMRVAALHRDIVVAQHAEDSTLTAGAHMHEGSVSRRLGVKGMPVEAETTVVGRDLRLTRSTGARYHCQHVSAKETVDLVRRAKESGMAVTAEVTPHHLTFDDSFVSGLDPNFKMYPPLRSEEDRVALIEGLREGVIDAVATDHAPHAPGEKEAAFADAPRGVIGLETAASATWQALEDPDRLFAVMSANPARILSLGEHGRPVAEGTAANIVVFDPNTVWRVSEFESKSSNSPFRGREMRGQVKVTIHRGEVVHLKEAALT